VEPLPGITPRMYSVDFENRPGDLGVSVVILADAPEAALEKVFSLFPEYQRASRRGHVCEAEYAEIDWETGRAFAVRWKRRLPTLLPNTGDARKGSMAGKLEGGQPG